jgi:hypothetical protein
MQGIKRAREQKKLQKEFKNLRVRLLLKGVPFVRFCEENSILRQSAEKAFNGTWNGQKAEEVRQKLIRASKEI